MSQRLKHCAARVDTSQGSLFAFNEKLRTKKKHNLVASFRPMDKITKFATSYVITHCAQMAKIMGGKQSHNIT